MNRRELIKSAMAVSTVPIALQASEPTLTEREAILIQGFREVDERGKDWVEFAVEFSLEWLCEHPEDWEDNVQAH